MRYTNVVTTTTLEQALSNGEFEPYIQPVVRTSDLLMSGGELLARWHHVTGQIIPPARFIEQISSAGLLSHFTQDLLCQTMSYLTKNREMLPQNYRLYVNVTPVMLADIKFTQMCQDIADNNRVSLVLELTESHPFDINRRTKYILDKLKAHGVEFALDDFGTGYSTLLQLRNFPINYIKIDKSFIQSFLYESTSLHIIESIIHLARKLHVSTIAEGVENPEQKNHLNTLGVDYLQGYYLGKPEMVSKLISKQTTPNKKAQ